jgi:hypothetical protein
MTPDGVRAVGVEGAMRLPDELIESVLWSLGAEESGHGLRKFPRTDMRCIAMMTPLDGGRRREAEAREVCVRDISADGASLLLATPLRDQRILLEIPGKKGTMSIECTVRHCDRAPEGGYAAGVKFEQFLQRPQAGAGRHEDGR